MSIHIRDFVGRRLHMIGIGGSSMSGLAGLLRLKGCLVSGSDGYDSYLVAQVRALGIPVALGHRAENVHGADLVIYSAAISPDNPERREAERLSIPQMERSTLLGQLMEGYRQGVCIAGTHGKTTATAMLAQILVTAGRDPAVHIGGNFDFIGGGTRLGGPEIFVAEACEFNRSFLTLSPTVSVLLNIDEDHLDCYRDIDHIAEAFAEFVSLTPPSGHVVGNGDDPRVLRLLGTAACAPLSFGFEPHNRLRPEGLAYEDGNPRFDLLLDGKFAARVSLAVGGQFNVYNALAALGAAHVLGVPLGPAAEALAGFTGVHRRFEHTGDVRGVALYHDYGHNPVEMRGALSVAKMTPHRRLWAVMQPHTYSRVKSLFEDYIHCCEDADIVLVTDIYAAREKDPGDIRSQMLVEAIAKTGQAVHLTPTFDDTEAHLRAHWQPGDLVLTMGCGNINELNAQIQAHEEDFA